MAKRRRAAPNRRKASKVVKLNQAVPRKRSEKKSQFQKAAYSQKEMNPGSSDTQPNGSRPGHTTGEDLWSLSAGMANQFAGNTLENYARAFSIFLPAAREQQVGLPSQILPMAQSPSFMRNGAQAITRELLNHFIGQMDRNFEAVNALTRSRSPHDFFEIQTDLAKGNLDSMLEAASRILIVAMQMTTQAVRLKQLGGGRV